jgi:hypothetical protein
LPQHHPRPRRHHRQTILRLQRAFAQAADHRVPAGLDAFGNRDLALAGQQLDGAHFAKIHTDRVIGPVRAARIALLGNDFLVFDLGEGLAFGFGLFFALDDGNAHFRDLGHHVLDLVRGHLVIGKESVDLFMGNEAALLSALQDLLDVRRVEIDQAVFIVLVVIAVAVA